MSEDIFEKQVQSASEDLSDNQLYGGADLSPEMEEQLRQIEALAQMDPSFDESK